MTLNDLINIQTAEIHFNNFLVQFLPINTTLSCKLQIERALYRITLKMTGSKY